MTLQTLRSQASDPAPPGPDAAFRAHAGRVFAWARALCGRDADAADITQEVFVRLLREAPPTPSDGALRGWLRRVTARLAIDLFRRRRRQWSFAQQADNPADSPTERAAESPLARLARRETCERARDALAGISDMQRLTLIAKCYDGITFREIAEELELSEATVKTHYVRGLDAIRRRLDAHDEEQP